MAVTLQQIRSLPGYQDFSDDDIVKHANAQGIEVDGFKAPSAPDEEAGTFRSYVGIPLEKGIADIGGAVGYGLGKAGFDRAGRALQDSSQRAQDTLTSQQSQQAQDDASKTLIDDNGDYGGYNLGTLSQDVFGSLPGTVAMGVAGAPLAAGVTGLSRAAGLGDKIAKIAGSGALGKGLAKGIDTAIGSAVGFGASEGVYSGASNATQVQNEIRNADINEMSKHPIFAETYHNETDPNLDPVDRLHQTRDILARKAGDDVFADTAIKTGLISMATGGGVFGMIRGNATKSAVGEAADGIFKKAVKGFALEGLAQEAPQSALEQRTTNQAKQDYLDPNQDINQGVLNAGLQGGIAGGVMGLFGGAGGTNAPDKQDDQQRQPDKAAQSNDVNTEDQLNLGDNNDQSKPVLGIPELIFTADGTSLNKRELINGFMANGASEQDALDYIKKITMTPVSQRTEVNLDPYRFLQERDSNRAQSLASQNEAIDPEAQGERQAIQSESAAPDQPIDNSIPFNPQTQQQIADEWEFQDALNEPPQAATRNETDEQARQRLLNRTEQSPVPDTNVGSDAQFADVSAMPSGSATDAAEQPELKQPAPAAHQPQQETINGSEKSTNERQVPAETGQERLLEPQKAPEKSGAFIPTHELSDGTPAVQISNNVYQDDQGNEYQDDYATAIQSAAKPERRNDHSSGAAMRAGRAVGENDNQLSESQQNEVLPENGSDNSGRIDNSLDPIITKSKGSYLLGKALEFKRANPKAIDAAKKQNADKVRASYEDDLNKALASAPFEVYAKHPSNKGVSNSILKQGYQSLQREYGIVENKSNQTDNETNKSQNNNAGESAVQGQTEGGVRQDEQEDKNRAAHGEGEKKSAIGNEENSTIQNVASKIPAEITQPNQNNTSGYQETGIRSGASYKKRGEVIKKDIARINKNIKDDESKSIDNQKLATKENKLKAKKLLVENKDAILKKYNDKELIKTLDFWKKWQPAKLIAFVEKFNDEQSSEQPTANQNEQAPEAPAILPNGRTDKNGNVAQAGTGSGRSGVSDAEKEEADAPKITQSYSESHKNKSGDKVTYKTEKYSSGYISTKAIKSGRQIGFIDTRTKRDGDLYPAIDAFVETEERRNGVATKLYDIVEKHGGIIAPLSNGDDETTRSPEAQAFRENRASIKGQANTQTTETKDSADNSESQLNNKVDVKKETSNSVDDQKQEDVSDKPESDVKFSKSSGDMDFAHEVLNELSEVDEIFRYPVSKSTTLPEVMEDVAPGFNYIGEENNLDQQEDFGADKKLLFRNEKGKRFDVYVRGNELWIDVSRFDTGERGSAVYAAVGNYAYNAGNVFIADPHSLSDDAAIRRTSAMLSLALRFGTTDFMEPGPKQLKGIPELGVNPLKWSGSDVDRTKSLIHTFLSNLQNQFPELKDIKYDFGKRQFVRSRDGLPVGWSKFNKYRAERGVGRRARAGEATARRGAFIQSLISSESGERPGILEQVLNRASSLVRNGNLSGMFSTSQSTIENPHTEQSLTQSIRKALDAKFGEGWFNRLLATGKFKVISRDEAEAIVGGQVKYHRVFHGSPHDHDGFDSSKIGTGEGAQAFGYGHYFTDKKAIAEHYRKGLSNREFINKAKESYGEWDEPDEALNELLNNGGLSEAQKELVLALHEDDFLGFDYPHQAMSEAIRHPEQWDLSDRTKSALSRIGKLYEVELAPTQDEYLDWDKPLSEQSEFVKSVLRSTGKIDASSSGTLGMMVYKHLSKSNVDSTIGKGSDREASNYLHSLGIRGIRYKAEGGKSDANNYVVFDDGDIKIEAKYSKNGDILAFYNPANDTSYFVHDNISKDTSAKALYGLVSHEVAVHQLQLLRSDKEFQDLLKRVEKMSKFGKMKEAAERVPEDTKPEHVTEEMLAYFVEKNPTHSIAQKLTQLVRKALRMIGRTLPVLERGKWIRWANTLNEADIISMATSALRQAPDALMFDNSGRDNEAVRNSFAGKKSENNNSPLNVDSKRNAANDWIDSDMDSWSGDAYDYEDGGNNTGMTNEKLEALVAQYAGVDGKPSREELKDAVGQYRRVEVLNFNKDGAPKKGAMLAPNGKPTNLNKVQWIQTRTENFKKWFGNSKVVDENGDPLVTGNDSFINASGQAKSATINTGTFNPNSNDIRFSKSPDSSIVAEAKRKAGLGPKKTLTQAIISILNRGLNTNKQAAKEWWAELQPRLEQGVFDKFYGIKLAEKEILGDVAHSLSGYISARLSTGSSSTMQALLLHGTPKWADGIIQRKDGSKGFAEILQPVKDDLENFTAWMVGRRADRLFKEGKENNFTRDEIDALLGLKQDGYQSVADDIADMNSAVLDLAEDAGMVNPESRKLFESNDYIPFYRLIEGKKPGPGKKGGLTHQTSGIKILKGSDNPMSDPLGNMMQNWAHLIDASMKNDALNKTLTNLEGSRFVESIPSIEFKQALIPKSQIKKLMKESGLPNEVVDLMPEELTNGIAKMWSVQAPTDPDVVRVMRDGKPEYYRVNDAMLLTSLTAVNQIPFGGIFKPMRYMKQLLTGAVTADPTFMARNFIRDSMHSWTIAEEKGFKLGVDSFHGAIKSFKEDGGYIDMMFAGASFQGGYGNYNNPDAARTSMDAALRKRGIKDIQGFKDSILDTPKKYWEMYRSVGDAIENANREAILENAKRSGAEKAKYLFEAKDLMDFSMQGSFTLIRAMSDMLPFFNARLIGLYRLAKAGKTPEARKMILAKGLSIAMFSLALLALNADNDDYEELEDWDKDQYWHFFFGDQHYRIPKPFELGLLFGTVPERSARALLGKDTLGKYAERMVHGASDTLAFNPVPQLFKPFIELYANKDMFTGRAIEGMSDEGKLPSARYNEYTSETMRTLSSVLPEALGASPKRLEHLMHGYMGALGMYALGASDMLVRELSGMPELPASRMDKLPIIKAFYQEKPAMHTKYSTEFYDMLNEVNQVHKTINAYKKEGRITEANKLRSDNADKLRKRHQLEISSKQLSKLKTQVDIVYRSKLGADEKRRRIDNLMQRSNEVARIAVQRSHPYFN